MFFFLRVRNSRKKGHLIKDKSKNFKICNKTLFTTDKMEIVRQREYLNLLNETGININSMILLLLLFNNGCNLVLQY